MITERQAAIVVIELAYGRTNDANVVDLLLTDGAFYAKAAARITNLDCTQEPRLAEARRVLDDYFTGTTEPNDG